ncbi:MAG: transcriptional regulator NrdR [Kiritimatiellaeota bacterium]|nr:transcriptional regulator NrdR [Kiritimatiellota bacterium]
MRCPKCGFMDDKVLDSRAARDASAVRRRRQCLSCGQRFTTFEEIAKEGLRVVKRDGSREEFSRQKLVGGVLRACEKRPVSMTQIEALADRVTDEAERENEDEVTTEAIGGKVMRELESLDEVAYVRFASVYKRFADVGQFLNAINQIAHPKSAPGKNEAP